MKRLAITLLMLVGCAAEPGLGEPSSNDGTESLSAAPPALAVPSCQLPYTCPPEYNVDCTAWSVPKSCDLSYCGGEICKARVINGQWEYFTRTLQDAQSFMTCRNQLFQSCTSVRITTTSSGPCGCQV
jgi:hypothetical protein